MTTLLAIETATAACSVAVSHDGAEIHLFEVVSRAHAERLLPMVATAMSRAGTGFVDVDAIAVSVGPGAFTSLRIGLAAARGLAVALDKPCFGVSSLEALAAIAGPIGKEHACKRVVVALDSKRGDVFLQVFSAEGAALALPAIVAVDAIALHLAAAGVLPDERVAVAGDADAITAADLRAGGQPHRVIGDCRYPTALAVVRLAAARWVSGERPPAPPRPLYLRPAETGPTIQPAFSVATSASVPG
ncbi:MAG: tRNA (adenosine(37)-N6)-threonylcarbamoyltransferase complex dimerization subunit type 1 TsaB [Rhodospirillales bacterium]